MRKKFIVFHKREAGNSQKQGYFLFYIERKNWRLCKLYYQLAISHYLQKY